MNAGGKTKAKVFFALALFFFSLNAATFLIMPLATYYTDAENRISALIVGSLVWISLLLALLFMVLSALISKKRMCCFRCGLRTNVAGCGKVFSNKTAAAMDILLIFSGVLVAVFTVAIVLTAKSVKPSNWRKNSSGRIRPELFLFRENHAKKGEAPNCV